MSKLRNMRPVHLAIGNFDGLHLGHRALLRKAVAEAREHQNVAAVLTFHPHPKRVLRLPNAPQLIYPIHHRCYLLRRLGFGKICVQPFDEAFAALTPEAFFDHLLRQFPTLPAVYVGEDYRFGSRCCGDVYTLEDLCRKHNITLYICPNLKEGGEKISSTRIRKALREGSIEVANHFLGTPYHCIGYVREECLNEADILPKGTADNDHTEGNEQRISGTIAHDMRFQNGTVTVPKCVDIREKSFSDGNVSAENSANISSDEKKIHPSVFPEMNRAGEMRSGLFFHTHCELKLKNGFYRGTLSNRHGRQTLAVHMEDGRIRLLSDIMAILRYGAGVLSFERKG